jgi:hypothetical protein
VQFNPRLQLIFNHHTSIGRKPMTDFVATTPTELFSALGDAQGGDAIALAGGHYGSISINNVQFSSPVTISGADIHNPPLITSLRINACRHLTIRNIHVSNQGNGGPGGKVVAIDDSEYVGIIKSEVNGLVDDIYDGSSGIYVKNCDMLSLEENYVHDVHNGIVVFGGHTHSVRENFIDYTASDHFKFGGVTNVLIENNTGGGNNFPSPTAHADFMQFQGPASDTTIRGNVFLAKTTEHPQGIFLNKGPYHHILIEENIVVSGKINAIKVSEGTNITVRRNTLLNIPNRGHEAAIINVPSGSVVADNISSHKDGSMSGSNVVAQWDDVNDINHYNDLFTNGMAGLGITLQDLIPVPGSLAETKGAIGRLNELLDGTPIPTPDPVPTPTPDPDPVPTPTPDPDPVPTPDPTPSPTPDGGAVFSYMDLVFTGHTDDAIVTPHFPEFETAQGSVELNFTANLLTSRQGLFSKDASGFAGGGHIGVLLVNSDILIRLQSITATHELRLSNVVTPGSDQHLVVTFGPEGMGAWLDGLFISSNPYSGGLIGNHEPIVVGANQWGSNVGTADKIIDPFHGTITRVALYDRVLSELEIAVLSGNVITPEEHLALLAQIAALDATNAALLHKIATARDALA